jgi:hypothetical protein
MVASISKIYLLYSARNMVLFMRGRLPIHLRQMGLLKASRLLNCVLIIDDNYKWTNCFIEIYKSRMVHR